MNKEASFKSLSSTLDRAKTAYLAKIFVPCGQKGTAPIWGYIPRQLRLNLHFESSVETAIDRGSTTMPNNLRYPSL